MKNLAALLLIATPAQAESYSGQWQNIKTGPQAIATMEILDEKRLRYCVQGTCSIQKYVQFERHVLEVRHSASKMIDGKETQVEHIWTYYPKAYGYFAEYKTQTAGEAAQPRAEAKFQKNN